MVGGAKSYADGKAEGDDGGVEMVAWMGRGSVMMMCRG